MAATEGPELVRAGNGANLKGSRLERTGLGVFS